ncbi:precorrin-3B synthase [Rhodococcus sp. IEGM 1379]|uniref:precorrin-3B synthase n=1 Tax=Rhodococcus sp. IEGM 1379 TaxID=3047086 RepID=UPI0024B696E1|nr:precorrin-3B synthase [Rhodococcus sp. IEGM 1379]MDI9913686.1 precorrin-3B synthase [Rhodococcus sp. IEGM 1379]
MPKDRSQPDACPGALQVHQAADGALARVRLPGGVLTPPQLQTLADAARTLGNGQLELTSRGNIQLRAVKDPNAFAEQIASAGLLPSATHERVRNILASPLSGRIGGVADIRDLVTQLDSAVQSDQALADLPGRTLFTLDDGRGDISGLHGDFGLHAYSETEHSLVLAGHRTSHRVHEDDAISLLLDAAHAFLAVRDKHWRLAEVPDGVARTIDHLGLGAEFAGAIDLSPDAGPAIGWLEQRDGTVALGGGLQFGLLDARLAEFLAAIEKPVVVTPWRSVLIFDLDEGAAEQVVRVLAPMGLIFDENSPWLDVTACTGSPGCEKSLADVRSDAITAVEQEKLPIEGRQHWAGCDRSCGRPRGDVADVIATGDGYRVNPTVR